MFQDDSKLITHVAEGGRLTDADEFSPRYRGELLRLMAVFVDSELAGAAGFVNQINRAPGLTERAAMARLVSEKFDHARMVLALMERFNVNTSLYVNEHSWDARLSRDVDLGSRRIGGDKRLNVFHYPVGGWLDAAVLNLLMGLASAVQLEELANSAYEPLADVMKTTIVTQEKKHAAQGRGDVAQSMERGGAAARAQAQASVAYWWPRVAATFGRQDSDRFDMYQKYGLRQNSNAALLSQWKEQAIKQLADLGLKAPK